MGPPGDAAANLELESFMAFWAEAGVNIAYADAPQDRLKPEPPRTSKAAGVTPALPMQTQQAASAGVDIGSAVQEARRLAEAAPDLAALEAAIAAFDGCPLKTQGASRAVFARGNPRATVMIVGEGPGADEDRLGQPFVGRSGKLLDRMLMVAGLTDQVFITNTVFWRPPGNRTPTPAEQAICRPFVDRAITLVQPKLLVLSGGAAAKSMLDTPEGILKLRGRWFDWHPAFHENGEGETTLPALPMLHPAFLLRQPLAKKQAWADLLMLTAKLDPSNGQD